MTRERWPNPICDRPRAIIYVKQLSLRRQAKSLMVRMAARRRNKPCVGAIVGAGSCTNPKNHFAATSCKKGVAETEGVSRAASKSLLTNEALDRVWLSGHIPGTNRGHIALYAAVTRVPRKPDPRKRLSGTSRRPLPRDDGRTCGAPASTRQPPEAVPANQIAAVRNVLKVPVVREFKARIAKAWENVGGKERDTLKEAAAGRKFSPRRRASFASIMPTCSAAGGGNPRGRSPLRDIVDDEGDVVELEIPTREARQAANQFMTVAMGESTPLAAHHDAFMKTLTIKARSLTGRRPRHQAASGVVRGERRAALS